MNNRDRRSTGNLNHAPDIAGGDHVRLDACDIGDLPVAQSVRNVRLENVVCPRRTATQMTLRYIFHHESILGKQIFRKLRDFLAVLKRTGGVIGNDEIAAAPRRRQIEARDILGDVLGQV